MTASPAHPLLCDTFLSDDVGGDRGREGGLSFGYNASSSVPDFRKVWGLGGWCTNPRRKRLPTVAVLGTHTHPIPLAPPQKPFLVSAGAV